MCCWYKQIQDFEKQHPEDPHDPTLWRAFARKNGDFITVANVNKAEMQRELARKQKGDQARATRVADLSSDDDVELDVAFPPLVVARGGPAGKVMRKWLVASRKRLGGVFPRPGAKEDMMEYARRMKDKARKLRQRKGDTAFDSDLPPVPQKLNLSAATKAIGQKWVRGARESLMDRVKDRSLDIHKELKHMLANKVTPEVDWYYGVENRLRGQDLEQQGRDLLEGRKSFAEDERSRIEKIKREQSAYETEKRKALDAEREALDLKLRRDGEDAQKKKERELHAMRRRRKEREEEIRRDLMLYRRPGDDLREPTISGEGWGTSPEDARVRNQLVADLPEEERDELLMLDNDIINHEADSQNKIEQNAKRELAILKEKQRSREDAILEKRRQTANQTQSIKLETVNKLAEREGSWQRESLSWLGKMKQKSEAKDQEEADQKDRKMKVSRRAKLKKRQQAVGADVESDSEPEQ